MVAQFFTMQGTPGTDVSPNWAAQGFNSGLVDGTPTTETLKFTNGAGKVFTGSTAWEIVAQTAGHAYGTKSGLNTPQVGVDLLIQMPASPVVASDTRFIDFLDTGGGAVARLIINSANKFRVQTAGSTTLFTLTAAHPTGTYLRAKMYVEKGTTTSNGKVIFELWDVVAGTKVHTTTVYNSITANTGILNIDVVRLGNIGGYTGTYQLGFAAIDPAATGLLPDYPTSNTSPTAAFVTSMSDLTVSCDGTLSNDPDGSIASYAWAFGDGSTGTGAFPSHTYAAPGTYTVGLIVTDNNGATSGTAVTHSVVATNPSSGVISVVKADTVSGGVNSVVKIDIPVDVSTGAQVNDLISGIVGTERGTTVRPTLAGASGVVTTSVIGSTNLALTYFWKRLTQADITLGYIRAQVTTGRGMVAIWEILSGAKDPGSPVLSALGDSGGASSPLITASGVTPTEANSYIQAFFVVVPVAAPYTRTFASASAGWVEIAEDHAGGGTGISPFVTGLRKQLGAGVSPVTGPSMSIDDVTTHVGYYAVTVSIGASLAPPVNANAGLDQSNIEPDDYVQLDGSGSTGKAPMTYAWSVVSGPTPFSWSAQNIQKPIVWVRGGMTPQDLILQLIVTDADGIASSPNQVKISILPADSGYFKADGTLAPYVDVML